MDDKAWTKKALRAQKRELGPQTPTDEAKAAKKLFFFQRLVDEAKRQALSVVRKRRKEEGKPPERKNRGVFSSWKPKGKPGKGQQSGKSL